MSRVRRNVRRTLRISEEQTPMAYRRIDYDPPEYETPRNEPVPLWVWVLACLVIAVVSALLFGVVHEALFG